MRVLSLLLCLMLLFSCNNEQTNKENSNDETQEQNDKDHTKADHADAKTDDVVENDTKEEEVSIPDALKQYNRLALPLEIPETTSPGNKLAALGITNQPALVACKNGAFILIKADINESAVSSVIFQLVDENGQNVGEALNLPYAGGIAAGNMMMSFNNSFKVEEDKITMNSNQTQDGETSKHTHIYNISPKELKKQD